MKFFSILLSNDEREVSSLPDCIHRNIESIQETHPDYEFELFTNEPLREFVRDNFDTDVIRAYDDLAPLAYKADLGRYCLLYNYGGVYTDISNFFFNPVCRGFPEQLYVYKDSYNALPWLVCNGSLLRPSGTKFLSAASKKYAPIRMENTTAKQVYAQLAQAFSALLSPLLTPSIISSTGKASVLARAKATPLSAFYRKLANLSPFAINPRQGSYHLE